MKDQSISLHSRNHPVLSWLWRGKPNPVGGWLCSLSSNQSQCAAGGASGRCECKEHLKRAISSPRALQQICVLWRLAEVPASSTLWGQRQDMTASATHQLWPCWKKRDRACSAKNAAEREGTAAAQEFLIVPTRGREAQSLSPPSPFPTPPGPHSSPQLAGLHCPRGCHLPPAQPEPSVLGTELQPWMDQEESTGPPYLTHLSLHQRPSDDPNKLKDKKQDHEGGSHQKAGL